MSSKSWLGLSLCLVTTVAVGCLCPEATRAGDSVASASASLTAGVGSENHSPGVDEGLIYDSPPQPTYGGAGTALDLAAAARLEGGIGSGKGYQALEGGIDVEGDMTYGFGPKPPGQPVQDSLMFEAHAGLTAVGGELRYEQGSYSTFNESIMRLNYQVPFLFTLSGPKSNYSLFRIFTGLSQMNVNNPYQGAFAGYDAGAEYTANHMDGPDHRFRLDLRLIQDWANGPGFYSNVKDARTEASGEIKVAASNVALFEKLFPKVADDVTVGLKARVIAWESCAGCTSILPIESQGFVTLGVHIAN